VYWSNRSTGPLVVSLLAGPWKEGDESWRAGYTTAVFGLCDRVLTLADFNALDWAAHIRAARAAVPSTRQLGNWCARV
jgi:hypothetical protein